ncbi:MAG: hypothetical protein JWL77_5687 [Chthonomonadaceae bacterium]|nr:hypothetical protein [Chthonomonadaceae bacterium]
MKLDHFVLHVSDWERSNIFYIEEESYALAANRIVS